MATKLLPFRAKTHCQKCGGRDIYARYCPVGDKGNYGEPSWPFEVRERILRHCRTCSFEWLEKPLDKKRKAGRP